MTAPCPIRHRAPMATRPSRTTWAPISVPWPTRTSAPMMEYGATLTPGASSARGSMMAVGWITSLFEPFQARLAGLVTCGSSAPSRLALLFCFLGLVVVGADDVVRDVRLSRGIEHGRALAFEDER